MWLPDSPDGLNRMGNPTSLVAQPKRPTNSKMGHAVWKSVASIVFQRRRLPKPGACGHSGSAVPLMSICLRLEQKITRLVVLAWFEDGEGSPAAPFPRASCCPRHSIVTPVSGSEGSLYRPEARLC